MKKECVALEVTRHEVDSEVIQMLTKQGFMDLFWLRFRARCKVDCATKREDVFDELNNKYFTSIGCYRYKNYESFRRRLK